MNKQARQETPIDIRPAPRALKDRMAELTSVTFAEHQARQPWAFPNNGLEQTALQNINFAFMDKGRQLKESPNAFAAYVDEHFAGFILLSVWARGGGPDMPHVSIDDICVVPEFRGRGVGRALLRHARALAAEEDWDSLNATVWTGNEASEALFRSEGFTVEHQQFRIGPDRLARDYPDPPKRPLWLRILDSWGFVAVLILGVGAFLAVTMR